jgi:AraC-like DNA-binding protein
VRDELAFDAEARRRIVDALRSGEPGRVEELLDDVLSHRVMERRMGSWGVYALFELLVQALRSIPGADPHLVHSIDLNRLAALPDDGERIRYCRSTFARIAAAVAGRHRGDDVAAGIVEFVDANFADPAMSLTLLSDRFRLSPIYISRLFKQKAGDNFLDYLNRRRVQRAKELLSAPRALVKGVGRTAGFASEVSFRRVFRKYEAISPAEFRRRADAAGAHAAPGA